MARRRSQDDRALEMGRRESRGRGAVANWGDAGADGDNVYRGGKFRKLARQRRQDREEEEKRDLFRYSDEEEEEGKDNHYSDSMDMSFTIDNSADEHAQVPPPRRSLDSPAAKAQMQLQERNGLLLPGHVDVTTMAAPSSSRLPKVENDEDEMETENEGAIGDFDELDGDRSGDAARYWEVQRRDERLAKEDCEQCGEKGHTKRACPHTQCLACGVLDEHSTRDCPMSRSCFRCGARGHQLKDCPKPRDPYTFAGGRGRPVCKRCGATSHSEATCSTLWRAYAYNYPQEWRIERKRRAKDQQVFIRRRAANDDEEESESSEEEEGEVKERNKRQEVDTPPPDWDPAVRWCYNCASKGNHWGDDCPLPRCHPYRGHMEPTAYSEFVSLSGPFAAHYGPPPPTAVVHGHLDDDDDASVRRYRDFAVGPSASVHVTSEAQRQAIKSVDELLEQRMAGRKNGRGKEPPSRPSASLKRGAEIEDTTKDEDEEDEDWFTMKQKQREKEQEQPSTKPLSKKERKRKKAKEEEEQRQIRKREKEQRMQAHLQREQEAKERKREREQEKEKQRQEQAKLQDAKDAEVPQKRQAAKQEERERQASIRARKEAEKPILANEGYKLDAKRANEAKSRVADYPIGDPFWTEGSEGLEALPLGIKRDHALTTEDIEQIRKAVGQEKALKIVAMETSRNTRVALRRVDIKWGLPPRAPMKRKFMDGEHKTEDVREKSEEGKGDREDQMNSSKGIKRKTRSETRSDASNVQSAKKAKSESKKAKATKKQGDETGSKKQKKARKGRQERGREAMEQEQGQTAYL